MAKIQPLVVLFSRMPRFLRFINRFCMEGPIYNVACLGKYLSGYETLVVGGSPLPHESNSGFILKEHGVDFIEIPEMGRAISPINDLRTAQKIKQLIQNYQPDIIHSHTFGRDGLPARIAVPSASVPIKVHTFHGHTFSESNHISMLCLKQVERRLAEKWSASIAISESQKNELVNTYRISAESKTHVIPLGIDLNRFSIDREKRRYAFRKQYGLKENDIAIGIVARLSPVKNHYLFLDAISEVKKHHPNVRAFIIGDGELRTTLAEYAKYLGLLTSDLNSTAIFTSWVKDVELVLPGLDIFALTSNSEGTPVSIIEAQAAGLPIVATDVGGVKDCMINNRTGLLVPPSNNIEMSTALMNFATDEHKRKDIGRKGLEFVHSKFHYAQLVQNIDMLYTSLHKR